MASRTALMNAVRSYDVEGVRRRIAERPEEVMAVDLHGNNALHYAAVQKAAKDVHSEIIAMLAVAGADVNAAATRGGIMGEVGVSDGYTPLHMAAANGLEGNAAALVKAGADVRQQNQTADQERNGQTPLHAMCCRADGCAGGESLARTLMGESGEVEKIRDAKGRTPLEVAIEAREYLITMVRAEMANARVPYPHTARHALRT